MSSLYPWRYRVYRSLWVALDWFSPPVCGGCGRDGYRWCPDCQRSVLLLSPPICEICGLPQEQEGICPRCKASPPAFRKLRSCWVFEGALREAMHQLKYQKMVGIGDSLAAEMIPCVEKLALSWQIEIVVPIPLGKKRLDERGYNQVELISRPLALAMGWMYRPKALRRTRETRSQVGLSAEERRENMKGAFSARAKQVKGRRVLLMDDVATTGATLDSAAQALCDAGASEVYALTVARALPRHGLTVV